MEGATTLYLVLKPNFTTPTGKAFFELGDIKVFDSLLVHGMDTTTLDFDGNKPKIITLTMQRSITFKTSNSPSFQLLDSNLFSIAELIYFPKRHSRQSIKMVNSYLALKYSVPITGVTENDWKDYWAADSSRYWDYTTDNQYDIRVLGLGHSDDEDFYQSQTFASSGSFIQLSLDSIKPQGQMPAVSIDEDAFLVLSERLPEALAYNVICLPDGNNPLGNWKLKPHNWSSTADYLYVTMNNPTKGISDSIWMTDGYHYTYIPEIANSSTLIRFRINLDSVHNGLHYFFTDVKGDPCDQITIDAADNILTIDNQSGHTGFTVKYLDLKSGLTTEQDFIGNTFTSPVASGEYQVWILDQEGKVAAEKVVHTYISQGNTSNLVAPSLSLFPNPILSGQYAQLVIRDLPSHNPVTISIYDATGKTMLVKELNYQNGMSIEIPGNLPGLYTVTVYQNGINYSQKLLVAGH